MRLAPDARGMAARKAPAKKPAPKKKPAAKKAAAPKRVGGRAGAAGKAEGDAPVQAYLASLPGWQREVGERFDAIVAREVPGVRRAVKWSVPFYGLEGRGWFASFGAFAKHVKVNFFRGVSLKPQPPSGEGKDLRAIDLRSAEELDETQMADWVRQAAKLPGWGS